MPVTQDYSVDTFIFIGAVLLSYLLLKDLDKSNGWFHPKGVVRMIFFYLNRYLRLSIPYGLVIMIFAGIVPLIVTEPMSARTSAYNEGEECRKFWWRHLLYINTWKFVPENESRARTDGCLGQTWYLAFDMEWFLVAPLVVYPLWRSKFGRFKTHVGIMWWTALFAGFFSVMVMFAFDQRDWYIYHSKHHLPYFPEFAPWGNRSHCYLLGILMGYILHSTKDKKIKIHRGVNITIWILILASLYQLTYGQININTQKGYRVCN